MKTMLASLVLAFSVSNAHAQSPAHESIVRYFKSGAEKAVKDAAWSGDHTFKVGVLDNGTRRDGFAMYVCERIRETGLRNINVKVLDIAALSRTNKTVLLGSHYCK